MDNSRRIEKVVQKFGSFEEADAADDAFYLSLKPQERLNILLELVRRANGGSFGRLERVCRIVPLKES